MNEEIFDILEDCLQELEKGVEAEIILARYPKFSAELRPILKAAAQTKDAPEPSPAAITRGRARLMQRAAELLEEKIAPPKRMIPFLQRIAISFALTATLVLSGTGLVGASSSALPGHKLYPVKRGWEDLRLFLTFDEDEYNSLEQEIEEERLHEVNELLYEEDDHQAVDFTGIFTSQNGLDYVSEVWVVFPNGAQLPNYGSTLHIQGWTTESDYVEVTHFEIVQDATAIPLNIESTPAPMPLAPANPESDSNQPAADESAQKEDGGSEVESMPTKEPDNETSDSNENKPENNGSESDDDKGDNSSSED